MTSSWVHVEPSVLAEILTHQVARISGGHVRHSNWPGIETVIRIAATTSDELIAIAEQIQDNEEVDLPYQGKAYRYPRRFFLVHAVAHSAEHRTEVKVALAHMGIQTPDLDGWNYAQAAGYGEEISAKS